MKTKPTYQELENEIKELRKKLSEAKREDYFKELIRNSTEGFLVIDAQGNNIFETETNSTMLGYTPQERIGKNALELLHTDDRNRLMQELKALMNKQGETLKISFRAYHKNGSIKYLEGTAKNMLHSPIVGGVIINYRDITDRNQSEQALKESEAKLSALVNHAADGLVIFSPKNSIEYVSQSYLNIVGYSEEEELNRVEQDLGNLIHPEDRVHTLQMFYNAIANKQMDLEQTYRWLHKEGHYIWRKDKVTFEYDENGQYQKAYMVCSDITKEVETEKSLKESLKQIEAINANTPSIIWKADIDKQGNFINTYISEAVDEFLALPQGTINNNWDTYFSYVISDYLPQIKELFQKGITNPGQLISFDYQVKKANGEPAWFSSKGKAYYENDTITVYGSTIDITDRKQAEEALRTSNQMNRSILKAMPDLMFVIDKNYVFRNYHSSSDKDLYAPPEVFLGKQVDEVLPPKLATLTKENVDKVLQTGEMSVYEYQIELAGKTRFYESRMVVQEENLVLSINHDITERKHNELEIKKLSNAIAQSPVTIVITDINGVIEYVNPKFTEITGYTVDEAFGQNPRVLKSGEHSEEYYKNLWETISSGNIWTGEFHNKKKNGELFWESATISPVKDNEGKITHYIAIKEDITEKKKMIEELVVAKEKAESATKLKTEFLAQISHEIRTPINAILSYAGLMKSELEDKIDEDLKYGFISMDNAGRRIIRTIDLILNMSEVQIGSYDYHSQKLDIEKIIYRLKMQFQPMADTKRLKFSFEKKTDDIWILGDEYSVEQILSNLIDNAIKFTKEGYVLITLDSIANNRLQVVVSDSGIGIDEKYVPHLFEPFSQEEQGYTRRYEGNGLGLALIKEYCQMNGASIKVISKKGNGSTFIVSFQKYI